MSGTGKMWRTCATHGTHCSGWGRNCHPETRRFTRHGHLEVT